MFWGAYEPFQLTQPLVFPLFIHGVHGDPKTAVLPNCANCRSDIWRFCDIRTVIRPQGGSCRSHICTYNPSGLPSAQLCQIPPHTLFAEPKSLTGRPNCAREPRMIKSSNQYESRRAQDSSIQIAAESQPHMDLRPSQLTKSSALPNIPPDLVCGTISPSPGARTTCANRG